MPTCKKCGAEFIWGQAKTKRGMGWVPLNPADHHNHRETCPGSDPVQFPKSDLSQPIKAPTWGPNAKKAAMKVALSRQALR
jgi:hypothetical protein